MVSLGLTDNLTSNSLENILFAETSVPLLNEAD